MRGRPRHLLAALVPVVVGLLVVGPGAARAAPIAAGFDLFDTDPTTQFDFSGPLAIPAGFFAPGSDPFTGAVRFGGEPLKTFHGMNSGDADTIVQRLAGVDPVASPSMPIPVQIMALNLVAMEPITVTVGGARQFWDVYVQVSPTQPSMGSMMTHQNGAQGGTFDSTLQVLPKFTFTRLSNPGTISWAVATSRRGVIVGDRREAA